MLKFQPPMLNAALIPERIKSMWYMVLIWIAKSRVPLFMNMQFFTDNRFYPILYHLQKSLLWFFPFTSVPNLQDTWGIGWIWIPEINQTDVIDGFDFIHKIEGSVIYEQVGMLVKMYIVCTSPLVVFPLVYVKWDYTTVLLFISAVYRRAGDAWILLKQFWLDRLVVW